MRARTQHRSPKRNTGRWHARVTPIRNGSRPNWCRWSMRVTAAPFLARRPRDPRLVARCAQRLQPRLAIPGGVRHRRRFSPSFWAVARTVPTPPRSSARAWPRALVDASRPRPGLKAFLRRGTDGNRRPRWRRRGRMPSTTRATLRRRGWRSSDGAHGTARRAWRQLGYSINSDHAHGTTRADIVVPAGARAANTTRLVGTRASGIPALGPIATAHAQGRVITRAGIHHQSDRGCRHHRRNAVIGARAANAR
jgi:hypothetical protein